MPFDQAPRAVTDALAYIKERVGMTLEQNAKFNEILSAAYMEGQSMSVGTYDVFSTPIVLTRA